MAPSESMVEPYRAVVEITRESRLRVISERPAERQMIIIGSESVSHEAIHSPRIESYSSINADSDSRQPPRRPTKSRPDRDI